MRVFLNEADSNPPLTLLQEQQLFSFAKDSITDLVAIIQNKVLLHKKV